MNHIAYIAAGSNLGDRFENLCKAAHSLEAHPQVTVIDISHFYETEPLTLRGERQSWYLNAALKVRSSLNAVRLLHNLQQIEKSMGRVRSAIWAPRSLDLDLLFFDDEIIRSKALTLPHPHLHTRRFVLEPLAEIAPNLLHPVKGVSVKTLLSELKDEKKVIPLYQFRVYCSSEGVLQTPFRERF